MYNLLCGEVEMSEEDGLEKLSLEDKRAIMEVLRLQRKLLEIMERVNEGKALENFERWVKTNKIVIACPSISNLICEYQIEQHKMMGSEV